MSDFRSHAKFSIVNSSRHIHKGSKRRLSHPLPEGSFYR